jgi:hypothetical protein
VADAVEEGCNAPFVKFWEPVIAALVGATLLLALTVILDPDVSKATVPKLLSSLVVGAIVGWMYDLPRETTKQWYQVFREAEALSRHLNITVGPAAIA